MRRTEDLQKLCDRINAGGNPIYRAKVWTGRLMTRLYVDRIDGPKVQSYGWFFVFRGKLWRGRRGKLARPADGSDALERAVLRWFEGLHATA